MLNELRPLLNLTGDRLHSLPMLIVYLTDGCNSRCVTCDIWKLPRRNMQMALAEKLASEFQALGVRRVILSGGEAMQHPEWPRIARLFRAAGAKVELLTNGLMLNKQAEDVIKSVDQLVVSLDGGVPETYKAIRGVDGFNVILSGMRTCADAGVPITTRTTIQRGNFYEMPKIIDAARRAGVRKVSFLAVDVTSTQAFGPRFTTESASLQSSLPSHAPPSPALTTDDLPEFSAVLDRLERDYAADFASGLMAESPAKLRRLYNYFSTLNGESPFPPPRCNAPHLSAVIEVDGSLRPCFFLPRVGTLGDGTLLETLNTPPAVEMRKAYRTGGRSECARCVCSLYQGPRTLLRGALKPPDSDMHSIVLDKIASKKNNQNVDIAAAYDTVAIHYDAQLAPAQWVRERLWARLDELFPPGARVLDVTAGTGLDTIHLAQRGVHIIACDISSAMLARLHAKDSSIETRIDDFNDLQFSAVDSGLDGIMSTFAGLNTSPNLQPFALSAAHLLRPGGILFIHMLNRWPALDLVRHLAGFRGRAFLHIVKSTRRDVELGGIRVPHYLHTPIKLYKRDFAAYFRLNRVEAQGVIRPVGTDAGRWAERLNNWERMLAHRTPFNALGTFFTLELIRK